MKKMTRYSVLLVLLACSCATVGPQKDEGSDLTGTTAPPTGSNEEDTPPSVTAPQEESTTPPTDQGDAVGDGDGTTETDSPPDTKTEDETMLSTTLKPAG